MSGAKIDKSGAWRWKALWLGLPKMTEHFVPVDLSGKWRQHLVWAKRDNEQLKNLVTQRFGSNSVLLSLLLSTEIGILFSPSDPAQLIRDELKTADRNTVAFWCGLFLCLGIFITLSALFANFEAWSIISSLGPDNVHAMLRSSIGLYGAQYPSRLIVLSLYCFYAVVTFFLFILMPYWSAAPLTVALLFLMVHTTSTYSAMGRIVIDTGAMGDAVFHNQEDEKLNSYDLYVAWLERVEAGRRANLAPNQIYRTDYRATLEHIHGGGDISDLPEGPAHGAAAVVDLEDPHKES